MALLLTETVTPFNPDSQSKAIEDLLAEIRAGGSNFSSFVDVFYSLMQAKIDPTFESIWVYTGLSSRVKKLSKEDALSRVDSAKVMFQLISACSATCNSSKSIGLLAPLVSEVYELVNMLLRKDVCSKKEKSALREAKSLVNAMLGYMSVCSSDNLSDGVSGEVDLGVAIGDLARVWSEKDLGSFFPLVSDDICKRMNEEDLSVNFLAGVVLAEAFFLKLILEFRAMSMGGDAEKELTNWVVGSITAFRNPYFFDVLVNMLIEPKLPVDSHLLKSEEEIVLRRVLYDAVVLVDYSFLSTKLAADLAKSLTISRLLLTHEAIEFCRKNKDQKRALSCSSAFSSSQLRLQVTKWIKMTGGADPGTRSFPKDLITELLTNFERQGGISFGNALMKHCLSIADPQGDLSGKISMNTKDNVVQADLFSIDKGEEKKDVESDHDSEDREEDEKIDEMTNAELISAARSMKAAENGGKKRKGKGNTSEKKSVKYLKYDLAVSGSAADSRDNSGELSDDSGSDSDVEDSTV